MLKTLFNTQKKYLNNFFETIDLEKTDQIVQKLYSCKGSIIFTGVGKSGIIANKLAMTMLCTGTKAFYISPTDALHGDIGIVSKEDIVIFLSKSGETKELLKLAVNVKKRKACVISIISDNKCSLATIADLFIDLSMEKEICPFNLAPTTSTTIQLIFGDILAVALMKKKSFSINQFAINHPSGGIGNKISLRVEDIMSLDLPLVRKEHILSDVLHVLSEKRCGALLVVDDKDSLLGIFTDGDFKRSIQKDSNFLNKKMEDLMTKNPVFVAKDDLAYDALKIMENLNKLISVVPVLENSKVIGILHIHDILQEGLK